MYKFLIEVDRQYSNEVQKLLEQEGAQVRYYIEMAEAPPGLPHIMMVEIAKELFKAAMQRLIDWYKRKKRQDPTFEFRLMRYSETTFKSQGPEIKGFETKSLEELEIKISKG